VGVKDTGCGIPAQSMTKIFDPFFSTRSNQSGTGLGLSLVIELVNNEGLGLTIHSEVGVGTNIELWLPEAKASHSVSPEALLESASIDGLTIVYIDDEELLLEAICTYLESQGAVVMCFSNPQEGLSYIDNNQSSIDLVITDNSMPGSIQGEDVYRHIAQNAVAIPCLVSTGYAGDVSAYAREDEILQKPTRLAQLKEIIATVCNKNKMIQ
jgi:CheY-like chemotaxis protein